MKFNEIEVYINKKNEITIKQGDDEYSKCFGFVSITPDQADIVADEIKRLAKELKEEGEEE